MRIPAPKYENLEELAGLALNQSRIVATALRVDLLPRLSIKDQIGPRVLLRLLDERRVLERQALVEIDNLEDTLIDMIQEGTDEVEFLVHDENMHSPAVWRETNLTPDADALTSVLAVLVELQMMVHAVHDILDAEKSIETLRLRGSA